MADLEITGERGSEPLAARLAMDSPTFDKLLHDKLIHLVDSRFIISEQSMSKRYDVWRYAEMRQQMYRYEDADDQKAKQAGKPTKFVLPISAIADRAVLMYLLNVFSSRNPVMELTPTDAATVEGSRMLEKILHRQFHSEQCVGTQTIYNWFSNARNYGRGWVKNVWDKELEYTEEWQTSTKITTSMTFPFVGIEQVNKLVPTEKVSYEGNVFSSRCVRSIFPDPRVPLSYFQQGEFMIEELRRSNSYMQWKKHDGTYFNVDQLKKHQSKSRSKNSEAFGEEQSFNEDSKTDEKDPGFCILKEAWIRLVPADYGLGPSKLPQIWIVTIGNDAVILQCEKAVLGSDKFPYFLIEDDPNMHRSYNPGTPELIHGIEKVIEWLINADYRSVCKAMNSNVYYKPDLLVDAARDLSNTEMGMLVQVAAEAPTIDSAIVRHEVPYLTGKYVELSFTLMSLLQRLLGVSDNIQNVPTREEKTATEIRAVNAQSMGRLGMIATLYATQGTIPLTKAMVKNLQKFEPNEEIRAVIQGEYEYPILEGTVFTKDNEFVKIQAFAESAAKLGVPLNPQELLRQLAELSGIRNYKDIISPTPPPVQANVMPDEQIQAELQKGNIRPAGQFGNPAATAAALGIQPQKNT
jgi:hypothetical protein